MIIVKIIRSRLNSLLLSFLILILILIYYISIFRTLGLGLEVISHISHIRWCGHNIDHGIGEKRVEDSETK